MKILDGVLFPYCWMGYCMGVTGGNGQHIVVVILMYVSQRMRLSDDVGRYLILNWDFK